MSGAIRLRPGPNGKQTLVINIIDQLATRLGLTRDDLHECPFVPAGCPSVHIDIPIADLC
jgi:hypothetical protein